MIKKARSLTLKIQFKHSCLFIDKNLQKDIQRYLYCEKFGISPYKGDYGKQPCIWVDKVFTIKKALARLEDKQIRKARNNGSGHNRSKISG